MTLRLGLLGLLASSACTVGGSSAVVGRWRAQRVVDTEVCIQPQADASCERRLTVGRDLPARRFSTWSFTWLTPGVITSLGAEAASRGFVLGAHAEYVRGRGGFGWGVRTGLSGARVQHDGRPRYLVTTPITLLAHAGSRRGAVYGGLGYSPVARDATETAPGTWATSYHRDGVHAVAGARVWATPMLTWSVETRVERFAGTSFVSLSGYGGLHF